MIAQNPISLALGFGLILVGLIYPFVVLWQLNRQLSGRELPVTRELAATIALTALLPLTAVLAGFWVIVPRAQDSASYTALLIGSAVALVVVLIWNWRISRLVG